MSAWRASPAARSARSATSASSGRRPSSATGCRFQATPTGLGRGSPGKTLGRHDPSQQPSEMALMKSRIPFLAALFLASIAIALAPALPAHSEEGMDDTMILVAKRQLRDQLYGSTILLVKPLGEDRHVGFIINKPTQMTLGKLFPTHGPSQKIADPVYLGGPFNSQVIFALVQRPDSPGGRSV